MSMAAEGERASLIQLEMLRLLKDTRQRNAASDGDSGDDQAVPATNAIARAWEAQEKASRERIEKPGKVIARYIEDYVFNSSQGCA